MILTKPPCESGLLDCQIHAKLLDADELDNKILRQAIKEGIKSQYCDDCYDYFYHKLENNNEG